LQFEYQDLQWMPDDGQRRELIDGDLFATPSPVTLHQTVSRRIQYELMTALERTGLASVFDAPMDVIFDVRNVVEPDLIIVSKERQHIITERAIEGVPDVVVEILSPGTSERDRHFKRRLYEQYRVPEYWIVDPDYGFLDGASRQGPSIQSLYRAASRQGPSIQLLYRWSFMPRLVHTVAVSTELQANVRPYSCCIDRAPHQGPFIQRMPGPVSCKGSSIQ
jgi:Uma2 family endonuclease